MEITVNAPVTIGDKSYPTDSDGNVLNEQGDVHMTKAEYLASIATDGGDGGTGDEPTEIEIDGVKYELDKDGNAVKEGTIFKTKSEIDALDKPADDDNDANKIQIDDVVYTLDADGNALTPDGKIFKTKVEIDALEDDGESTFDINEVAKKTGLTVIDNDNNPITYSNDEEGIAAYTKDVYTNAVNIGINKGIQDLYASNPLIKDVIEHIKLNNSLEGFNQDIAYSNMQIDEANEDAMISLIRTARKHKGDSEAEINQYVTWAKNDKAIVESAKTALSYMQNIESETSKVRSHQLAEKNKLATEKAAAESATITNIINNGKVTIGDEEITLPKVVKVKVASGKEVTMPIEQIHTFLTEKVNYTIDNKPVQLTRYEAAKKANEFKITTEEKFLDALRIMTGVSMSDLITRKVNNKTTERMRIISTKKGKTGGTAGATGGANKGDIRLRW